MVHQIFRCSESDDKKPPLEGHGKCSPSFLHYYCNRCYNANSMVLSNRTLKEGIGKVRIVIKPLQLCLH